MAAQDVREIVPRVRRAIEGPQPLTGPAALSDDQLLALAADSIADIILITVGEWPHKLEVTHRTAGTPAVPDAWAVDPGLEIQEESVVAAQAALTFYFHLVKDNKVMENIQNEGQTWEWQKSPNFLRDQLKLLQDERDRALTAVIERYPVMARYASILAVRDRLAAVMLEPYVYGGQLPGGMETAPNVWLPVNY